MLVDGAAVIARIRELLAVERRAAGRWLVALSGGLDSTVLLHLLATSPQRASLPPLLAVHVHHGLQADADSWDRHCHQLCSALAVDYHCLHVRVQAQRKGLEDAARAARYQALAKIAATGDVILMAHHADDQLETMLLHLARGAGLDGMTGIPPRRSLGGAMVLRPLLDRGRDDLQRYAVAHGLCWISDPSNEDPRHDRNYLRRQVVPELAARWPHAARSAARTARHLAVARDQLAQWAAERLDECDYRVDDMSIAATPLRQLAATSRLIVARAWLGRLGLPPLAEKRLAAVVANLLEARSGANPRVCVEGVELWRWRDRLYAVYPQASFDAGLSLQWHGADGVVLPGAGRLWKMEAPGAGLRAFDQAEIRFRRGGERSHPAGRAHSSTLKKMLQEFEVPPWLRERVPLLYLDGELAAVGDFWVETGFTAAGAAAACRLRWEPGVSLSAPG